MAAEAPGGVGRPARFYAGLSIEFLSNYVARVMPDGLENKVNEWVSRFERSRAPGMPRTRSACFVRSQTIDPRRAL